MYFCYFVIYLPPPGKGQGPSFEQTWIPFAQGYFGVSLVVTSIGQVVLKSKIKKFCQFIFSISYHIPLEKDGTLPLNKLEFSSPKDALCQLWLKFAKWFWRREFLNFVNVSSLFPYYLPLEEIRAIHFLFTRGCFVPSLFEIGMVVLEKKIKKCEQFTTTTTTDNGQIVIRKASLSLRLRWAKNTNPHQSTYPSPPNNKTIDNHRFSRYLPASGCRVHSHFPPCTSVKFHTVLRFM